jgi:hypothetical protein
MNSYFQKNLQTGFFKKGGGNNKLLGGHKFSHNDPLPQHNSLSSPESETHKKTNPLEKAH